MRCAKRLPVAETILSVYLYHVEYKEYKPGEALVKYVKCYWSLEDLHPQGPSGREKIFPDGCTELIFHYGDHFKKYDGPDSFHIQEKSFIHGQLKKYIEIEPTGKVGVFSARFQPGGLQPFIPLPVSELTHTTFSLETVWGKEGKELEKKMLGAADNEQRQELLEGFLLKRIEGFGPDKKIAEHFVDAIIRTEGNVSIDTLALELNISKRQLERIFFSCVGLKPKMLARIIRFHKALKLIESREMDSFTEIAYESGFYDQAHFIKDFKEITGLNPKKYFSENLELAKFFNF